jgi:hypothetical protein
MALPGWTKSIEWTASAGARLRLERWKSIEDQSEEWAADLTSEWTTQVQRGVAKTRLTGSGDGGSARRI